MTAVCQQRIRLRQKLSALIDHYVSKHIVNENKGQAQAPASFSAFFSAK
jgi:hypothetical protein